MKFVFLINLDGALDVNAAWTATLKSRKHQAEAERSLFPYFQRDQTFARIGAA